MPSSLQGLTARQIGRRIRDALRCKTCGKSIVVLNTAGYRQPFRAETVTVDTHCSCVGGPAYMGAPVCATCNDAGEITDPRAPIATSYEDRLALGSFGTIPCPDCTQRAEALS